MCAWSTDHLTIVGVHGRAHLEAAGQSSEGKAIWVIAGNDTTIENIEFSGARVPDQNGAGIRQEGENLLLEHCYFHDNQEGILAADNPASSIVIDSSVFAATAPAMATRTTSTSTTSAASRCATATRPTPASGIWSSRARSQLHPVRPPHR